MKQTVHFKLSEEHSVMLGHPAWVFPIDHPGEFVSNKGLARTSEVISVNQEGNSVISFETQNTNYVGV